MTAQLYWYPKCSTCQRAHKELDMLGVSVQEIDLKTTPPNAELILSWLETSGFDKKKFFNTSGISYRELGLKDKIADLSLEAAADLLASDGMLIKRPILLDEDGKILQIGYRTDYETLLA
ncbi:Spx/MgsR family RNA polymerase-binding regulatory protein [Lactococcus raffinolactis]|uniref:Spx/MgsR family RNA polymerase-binding regulatory protein n=1 Tax=Pseudolactococcus raffinolactis TaxID=1366 RepID=A0A6H0UGI8_9LACT|nr:arsenate reductase family protein [Lactococcus raffinolactis]QIW53475.1 Spx/MgsR family RNA polymerase-binding regulatory protein [Lactococcus raffinolactis]QIW56225.1 arsenate reductase family protein [Lactococcus raffinolactis]